MILDMWNEYHAKEKLSSNTKYDAKLKGNEFTIKEKQWDSFGLT